MKSMFEAIQEAAAERAETTGYGSVHASCVRSKEVMTVTAITEADTYDMLVTLYTYRVDGTYVGPDEIEGRMVGALPALVAGEL